MRCLLYPVRAQSEAGFAWRWRTLDGTSRSRNCYRLFYQCVEDAQMNGHVVQFEATVEAARRYGQSADESPAPDVLNGVAIEHT